MNNTHQQQITDDLFYEMPLHQTDAALLLGCKSMSGKTARDTAKLYHKGAFNKVVVAGGVKTAEWSVLAWVLFMHVKAFLTGDKDFRGLKDMLLSDYLSPKNEAAYMLEMLLACGVKPEDIIMVDGASKHTGAIIENSKSLLKDFNSVSLITYAPNQHRSLATARFHEELDSVDMQTIPVYAYGKNGSNWHQSLFLRWLISNEHRKIVPKHKKTYIGKFCKEIDIAHEIQRMEKYPVLKAA